MADIDRYEATGSAESSTALERKYASALLGSRDRGFTFGHFYRQQAKNYLGLVTMVGIGIAYFAWVGLFPGSYIFLGLFMGTLLRDYGIARNQKKLWPIHDKLLDWSKVKRLAGIDPLDG